MITPIAWWRTADGDARRLYRRLYQLALFFAANRTGAKSRAASADDVDQLDFERFVHQFEHDIFAYIWRMTGEIDVAYDLSQETFLRAWQSYGKIAGYDEPRAWLFRVATNLAINYKKRLRIRQKSASHNLENEQPRTTADATEQVAERACP